MAILAQEMMGRETAARVAGFAGDLLLAFDAVRPVGGRAAMAWSPEGAGERVQLWSQPPQANWKGFPLMAMELAGWHAWLGGELYGLRAHSDWQQVVRAILHGERPASDLNGHFLLLAREEPQGRWHVWMNRFASFHAYHACNGGRAALGTSFNAVAQAASRRQLDWHGLTGFFGCGFFPEDRTFYEDVRILRPATHYIFSVTGEQLSAKRYWDWHHEPDYRRTYDDTVAEFADIFGKVMCELLGGGLQTTDHGPRTSEVGSQRSVVSSHTSRIALPISGGLDSRCTVAAVPGLRDHGTTGPRDQWSAVSGQWSNRLWAYSYGYSDDSVETRIARQVAQARGLPFEAFTIEPYLFDRLDQILGAVEGFQDITQCRQAFIADQLRQNADYVIAAHWGDVWLDDMGLVGTRPQDHRTTGPQGSKSVVSSQLSGSPVIDHTLKKMAKRGRAWLLENVCAPRLGKETPEPLLREFVESGMRPLSEIENPDFRVKAFKTDHWSFRWTLASIRMFQGSAFPRLPFYDTRLADFFCTVPSEYVAGRRLQIDYLKRFAPDLARIKWQARDANLFSHRRSPLWSFPKRALSKAARTLSGKQAVERNWEVQFGGKAGRANLENWLTRRGLKVHEFVVPSRVQSLVNDFYDRWPDPELGYTVSMLLTFSTWLEQQQ